MSQSIILTKDSIEVFHYFNFDNIFLANGNIVKRFKKISENNIKNGDKIQLQNSDFE